MLTGSRALVCAIATWAVPLGACTSFEEKVTFSQPQTFAGKEVSADVLNDGRENYMHYCYACHGSNGDGKGPASRYYRPPPRDFSQGMYKFGGVVETPTSSNLPHDEDFVRIVRRGLHGTAMLPWDIPDRELLPIIQYIKTFSDVWQEEQVLGKRIPVDTNPWVGKEKEAIARGEKIYHGFATCQQCHPAYQTLEEIYQSSVEVGQGKAPITELRLNAYQPEAKESDYEVDGRKMVFMPPDFLFNQVRSGREVTDLYRVISSGIPGTAMTTWYKALPEPDVWAIAYYVQSLIDMQGKPEAFALRERLATQGEFVPPAVAPTPPPTEPSPDRAPAETGTPSESPTGQPSGAPATPSEAAPGQPSGTAPAEPSGAAPGQPPTGQPAPAPPDPSKSPSP